MRKVSPVAASAGPIDTPLNISEWVFLDDLPEVEKSLTPMFCDFAERFPTITGQQSHSEINKAQAKDLLRGAQLKQKIQREDSTIVTAEDDYFRSLVIIISNKAEGKEYFAFLSN